MLRPNLRVSFEYILKGFLLYIFEGNFKFLGEFFGPREFTACFEKYRHDEKNFSLYIWGHAMIMLDHYLTNEMLLQLDDVEFEDLFGLWKNKLSRRQNVDPEAFIGEDELSDPSEWTYYGEPGVYP